MIIKFYNVKYLFYIDATKVEKVFDKLKKSNEFKNIKNLKVSSVETDEQKVKDYCKSKGIDVSYSDNKYSFNNICLDYDLVVDDEKLKDECRLNNVKYDESIKILDENNLTGEEKELYNFIASDLYEKFVSESYFAIEDAIADFEYDFS